jgi:hypothetical protein
VTLFPSGLAVPSLEEASGDSSGLLLLRAQGGLPGGDDACRAGFHRGCEIVSKPEFGYRAQGSAKRQGHQREHDIFGYSTAHTGIQHDISNELMNGAAAAARLCWYWADPLMYRGYWDSCD